MSEEKRKTIDISDQYYGDALTGVLYCREPMKSGSGWTDVPVSNFTPKSCGITRHDNGYEVTEVVRFKAFRNGVFEPVVELQKADILSHHPDQKFSLGCRVYPGRYNAQRLAEAIQVQCENAEISTVFGQTGFRVIDGERVYLNVGNCITKDGISKAWNVELDQDLTRCFGFYESSIPDEECYKVLTELIPNSIPDWIAVPSISYVFMSTLNSMLRAKGMEPSFLLYFIGRTGTYKTSWAKVLHGFFGRLGYGDTAPISFMNDTTNRMGHKLALISDMAVLADDIRPNTTTMERAENAKREKFLSSAIGDRSARGRLNADSTAKATYIPRANVIVTAEDAYNDVGASAIARSISVELQPNSINFDHLCVLQKHTEHLNKFMQLYLRWLICHYDSVAAGVEEKLEKYRAKFASAGHARLATAFSNLSLGYRVLLDFLVDKGQMTEVGAEQKTEDAIRIFLKMCSKQSDKVANEKPTTLFVKLLNELIHTKKVRIHDLNAKTTSFGDPINSVEATEKTVGYRDNDYYYLIPTAAYNAVVRYYAESGYTFPASAPALWKAFADEKLLITDKGRTDRRKSINGKTSRYIALFASVVDKDEEGGEA